MKVHDALSPETVASLINVDGSGETFRLMVALFIKTSPSRVEALARATDTGNLDDIRHAAHALRGSALVLGASRLGEVMEYLEHRARDGCAPTKDDLDHVRELTAASAGALRSVCCRRHQADVGPMSSSAAAVAATSFPASSVSTTA